MIELTNKVAFLTGAGTGIGRAIALELAKAGVCLAATDIDLASVTHLADEINAAGGNCIACKLDVTQPDEARAALNTLLAKWKRVDLWLNNAGVSTMRRFVDLTEQDWDFNMDINAKGAFLCSQVAVRQMMQQAPDPASGLRGKIINTASMAGKRGNAPYLVHYVASKFAVVGLTQAMAGELAPHGITVNAVCPGYVRTGMQEREVRWEAELRGVAVDDVRQLYIADTPLKRLETAEDVAKVVLFLASPLSDFMTGVSVSVNGGSYMD